ncbi:ABC transporter permease [Cryobacterium sp. TMS1-13-1]|uniref:ABC transporter permease n=1 Tax=Cryobacterium sp. TMS1-13-1 TaxID=1259220 RepID=UPI001A7E1553|nr:FtsX-like permease family protein [Cryobacterium sp. TMS1-13-1]
MTRVTKAPESERGDGLTFVYKVHMATAMIRTNPRSVRTFVSVAIATFGLLLSFAAINAMATMMSQSARDIISGDVSAFAEGYQYSMLSPQSDVVYYLGDADTFVSDLQQSEDVADVRPRITAGALLSTVDHDSGVVVVGSDFQAEGYLPLEGEAPQGSGQICVNPDQVEELGIGVGDTVSLSVAGAPTATAVTSAKVSCVYDNSRFGLFRSSFVLMDVVGMQGILDRPDSLTQVLITLDHGVDSEDAATHLTAQFPDSRFSTAEKTADLIFTIQTAQQAVMWTFVVVTALICAVLIGNVVFFGLRRERGEIATMRTMGFDARAVRHVYSLQVVIIGSIMVALGTVTALLSVWIVGSIGIPIGAGQQLFGDDTLYPRLSVSNVVVTALLLLGSLVAANVLSTRAMLKRSPIEMSRDD